MKKLLVLVSFIIVSCGDTSNGDVLGVELDVVSITRDCKDSCSVDSCIHKLDTLNEVK